MDKPDKGHELGSCNRTACQRPGADWFNHSTQAYYCRRCADWLNTDPVNREFAHRHYGHDLCTPRQAGASERATGSQGR